VLSIEDSFFETKLKILPRVKKKLSEQMLATKKGKNVFFSWLQVKESGLISYFRQNGLAY
jgi:hypothetical protein